MPIAFSMVVMLIVACKEIPNGNGNSKTAFIPSGESQKVHG
jgi:hypothetical protein